MRHLLPLISLLLTFELAYATRGNYYLGRIKYTESLNSSQIYTAEFSMQEEINEDQWELLSLVHMKMRCGEKFFLQVLSYPRQVQGKKGLYDSAQLQFSCHDRPMVSGDTHERVIQKIRRYCARNSSKIFEPQCEKFAE